MDKFFITVVIAGRETAEIAIVLAALLGFAPDKRRLIFASAAIGLVVSIVLGYGMILVGERIPKFYFNIGTIGMGAFLLVEGILKFIRPSTKKDPRTGLILASAFTVIREATEMVLFLWMASGKEVNLFAFFVGVTGGATTGLLFRKRWCKTTILIIGTYLILHGAGLI